MNATKSPQASTSGVSSRHGQRTAKQGAKRNGNANKITNSSFSGQEPAVDIEVSSNGKTRIVRRGMEYKSDNGWISAIHDEDSTENFRDLTEIEADEARRPNKGKFLNRARKHALGESTRQKRNEVKEQRSEKLKGRHKEIKGAATPLALPIPLPQGQGRKRKREPSSLDPESEEENTRPAKRQEWASNIDPALLHLGGSGEASNAFFGSVPDFGPFDPFVNSPSRQSEVPELPEQIHNSDDQEFEFDQDSDVSTNTDEGSSGPVEETPLYMDPPAATGPYYLNAIQLQAFAEKQLLSHEVDFRWIRPRNQTDEVSIQMALHYTREDCWMRLEVQPLHVPSTPWETYSHQYLEMQAFFRQLWGYIAGGEEAPSLVCLEAWDGGFDGWKAPSVDLD